MEFSFESNTISFRATAKKIVVDWGDSTTDEYADINKYRISHTCPNSAIRTVKIQEEELTELLCYSNQLTSLDVNACSELTLFNRKAKSEKPLTEQEI
jgi:hypothetical protein